MRDRGLRAPVQRLSFFALFLLGEKMSVEGVTSAAFDVNNNSNITSTYLHTYDVSEFTSNIVTHFFAVCVLYYAVAATVQLLLFLLHMTFNRGKTQQATQKRIPGTSVYECIHTNRSVAT